MAPTILITGASHGIGKATTLLFARHGYDTILAAREMEPLAAVAEKVQGLGQKALAIPTDTRDAEQVKNLVQQALDSFGTIDVLLNNAGICNIGPVEEMSLEDWHRVIDTNLWGYIHTIHALLPHFLQRGAGTIVNVGSIGGKVPVPYMAAYTASKYAVAGLTEALHAELKPKGIHVAGIHPNLTNSDFTTRALFLGKDEQEAQQRRQQMNQLLSTPAATQPEDVAKAIWDAVQQKKDDILVGSANLSAVLYRLFPGLTQWVMQRSFEKPIPMPK
jgi:short-subunit dehydrogenase